ncbi:diguanylate cyclase [Qipengyuania sp. XHP0207]|uniref:GGDEF domain-containing protein n=1 Tax=Qipengyuania sp. XHP0207 TaxID=3038078 RepID=UPI0024204BAA|nr:diguanylate cyclase [Qipengyuania sp. XHP0207]MDG5748532.1 diguanylate cyclase [Qipengyuania sp. XHP0207]
MWLINSVARRSRGSGWRAYFLIACVALLAVLLGGASWSAYRSSVERNVAEAWQVHTLEVLLETDRLRTSTLQQIRGERGYLLTGDANFLRPYESGRQASIEAREKLAALIADNAEQTARLRAMDDEFSRLGEVLEAMIEQQQDGRGAEAIAYVRRGADREAIEAILSGLEQIEATERQLLADRTEAAQQRARENELYQYGLALVGLSLLVLAMVTSFHVRRALDAEAEIRRELLRSAATDPMTGLPNRRSFMEALARSLARADADPSRDLCIAIFDIDHFKRINDRFGHPAGDAVICEVGARAHDALRKRDLVARIGGEEFAIILPKANLDGALAVCERLRMTIDGQPVRHGDAIIPFTISIGVAEFQRGDDMDHIMARADGALYEAKTGGRNQVRIAA